MKHIMIGVPAALLLVLVTAAGILLHQQPRETRFAASQDDALAGTREPAPPRQPRTTARRLPTVAQAVCVPLPGHACWAGRVRVPAAVLDGWLRQRSDRAASVSSSLGCFGRAGEDGDEDPEAEDSGDPPVLGGAAVTEGGGEVPEIADAHHAPAAEDEEEPAAEVAAPVFIVEAVPRASPPGGQGAEPQATEVVVAADGTFVAQLPPGIYDLEAASVDDLLVGALERLQAIAGEARGDVDLTMADAVSLSGTLVDEHGFDAEGTLQVQRLDQAVVRSIDTDYARGSFTVDRLRPGTYTLVARVGGAVAPPVHISAPGKKIELRAPALFPGMLLVPQQPDGECPPVARVLMNSMDAQDKGESRRVAIVKCRAIVWNVRASSRWRVTGQVGPHALDQVITFGTGPTLPPVCLTGWCAADSASVNVRVAPVTGGRSNWLPVHLLDGPADGPAKGERLTVFTGGFRAGFSYTLSVGSDVVYAPMTVTLVPGVNTVVFRPR